MTKETDPVNRNKSSIAVLSPRHENELHSVRFGEGLFFVCGFEVAVRQSLQKVGSNNGRTGYPSKRLIVFLEGHVDAPAT